MKVTDTKSFIDKAKLVHGDKYNYDKVEYVKTALKVIIHCPKHGGFEQTPNKHLGNRGCYHCGREIVESSKRLTLNQFIEKAKAKHGDKYDYHLVEYKNNNTKVKIICNKGHIFKQTPMSHLSGRGCCKCAGLYKTTEQFIKDAKLIHGDKYDYSQVNYTKSSTKVKIKCNDHGFFEQTPSNHIHITRPQGCPSCGKYRIIINGRNNPVGWTVTNWAKSAERSKHFDSFKVYIIKCWNDSEEFYKIGRTFNLVKKRFKDRTLLPYKYEVIKVLIFDKNKNKIDNASDCFNKENELKRLHKEFKYIPKIKFYGMYECFSKITI